MQAFDVLDESASLKFHESGRITDDEITFVIQGPAAVRPLPAASQAIGSVRRCFPGSRIVLSTWNGEDDAPGLGADEIVRSDDPGAIADTALKTGLKNNVNRQIVSTNAGLARVRTRFAAKLRSDARVVGRGFTGLAEAFPLRRPQGRLFQRRITISREFTRSARSFVPLAYHPSDLFQFGLTSDLLDYWDVPLLEGPALAAFIMTERPKTWFRMFDRFRYTTEQYLFLARLRRAGYAKDFRNFAHLTPDIARESEFLLFNNFLPCEPALLGVVHAKFARRAQRSLAEDCLGLREFLSWYASEAVGVSAAPVLGGAAPAMSAALRAERVGRELVKRNGAVRALYAGRYLDR